MHQIRLLIILALFGSYTHLLACSCKGEPIVNEIAESNSIFVGKMTTSEEFELDYNGFPERYQRASFQVIETFKGVVSRSIEVITEIGSSCGMSFLADSTYLVFAYKSDYDDNLEEQLVTGYCTATRPIRGSETTLSKLRKLENKIDIVDQIPTRELYDEIWKDELFWNVDEYAKLLLTKEEESEFIKAHLRACQSAPSAPNQNDSLSEDDDNPDRIMMLFEVDEHGKTANFETLYGSKRPNEVCIEIAEEFVSSLGPWQPGKISGINVKSLVYYMVDFSLTKPR